MLININKSLSAVSGLLLGVACLSLVGCSNKWSGKAKTNRHKSEQALTHGVGESTEFINKETDELDNNLKHHANANDRDKDTYFFAFDRFDVAEHDLDSIHKHADYLKNHREKKIYIYGHTDMRGSREYNVALGERRAKAVTKLLIERGVLPNQIVVVSYGAEKPAVHGSDETAYSKNRRAQAVYQ